MIKDIKAPKELSKKEFLKWFVIKDKIFLREIAREWWYKRAIFTECSTTGWQMEIKKEYLTINPTKGDEILAIGRMLKSNLALFINKIFPTDREFIEICKVLWKSYRREINKLFKTLKIKKLPLSNYTKITKELIERGFESMYDVARKLKNDQEMQEEDYIIVSKKCLILYPKVFKNKKEAQKIQKIRGIIGITKIIQIKTLQTHF